MSSVISFVSSLIEYLIFCHSTGVTTIFPLTRAAYEYFVGSKAGDFSDLAIEVAFFGREVIPDKHHLRALLELQGFLRRIGRLREVAHDFSFEGLQSFVEAFQSLSV